MRAGLRLLVVLSLSSLVVNNFAQAQTAGSGSILIGGSLQGPLYPCGVSYCPTYDSGQITISVAGFSATASYGYAGGQTRAEQLAMILTAQLNSSTSPVTVVRSNTKMTIT